MNDNITTSASHDDQLLLALQQAFDDQRPAAPSCLPPDLLERRAIDGASPTPSERAHLAQCLFCLNDLTRLQSLHSLLLNEELPYIVGESARMREIHAIIQKAASWDANVCIEGENGTGKELVARARCTSPARGAIAPTSRWTAPRSPKA